MFTSSTGTGTLMLIVVSVNLLRHCVHAVNLVAGLSVICSSSLCLHQEPLLDGTTTPTLPQPILPVSLCESFPMAVTPPTSLPCAPVHNIGHTRAKMGIQDFNFLMVLGKGSFGKVGTDKQRKQIVTRKKEIF